MDELLIALAALIPNGKRNHMMFITSDDAGRFMVRWRHYDMQDEMEILTLVKHTDPENLSGTLSQMVIELQAAGHLTKEG